MSEIPICSYCAEPCDRRPHFFRIERWEGGRVVQRGHACGIGCLGGVNAAQRDGNERPVYEKRGLLTLIPAEVEVAPLNEHGAG